MKMHKWILSHKKRALLFLFTIVAVNTVACAPIDTKKPIMKAHLPHELHADMSLMAKQIATLSNMSLDNSRSERSKSTDVLASLDRIEAIASGLGGEGVVTNYSVINRYMGAFLYDIQIAREFALRDPPNHFPSYTLVKSCLSCHQSL